MISVPVILLLMIGFMVSSVWHARKCQHIYNQVVDCVGNHDLTMYGEYNGQIVEIAPKNRHPILNTITDKIVDFTSEGKMPNENPVIIRLDDKLVLSIYPTKSKDLFVKHVLDQKSTYYFIKGGRDFSYLKKMVSQEGWIEPNIVVD